MQSIVIGSIFLLIFAVQQGSAIKCYNCNSHRDTRCGLDIPPADLSGECDDHKNGLNYTFCRKISQVIEFSVNNLPPDTRIIRSCGWYDNPNHSYKNKCYQRAGFGGRQEVCACTTDNCNSAGTLKSTFGIIITILLVKFLFFKEI